MIHKQISLPEALNEQITQRAKRLQTSEERVIRDLLSLGLSLGGNPGGTSWRNSGEALHTLDVHFISPVPVDCEDNNV